MTNQITTCKRMYFLVPDERTAEHVVQSVSPPVAKDDIHVIASNEQHTLKESLPDAAPSERTDVLPAAKSGVVAGAAGGLFAGLVALTLGPAGAIGTSLFLAGSAASGAALGGFSASLVGIGFPNSDLEPFERAIQRGEILMLIDVDDDSEAELMASVGRILPDAEVRVGCFESTGTGA
ncbi:MAG: hypothetical protein AAF610_15675 [Pseudomonadota bacterium]